MTRRHSQQTTVSFWSGWKWLILAFALATRVINLQEPKRYIFDEVYHAVTAKLIAHNDARAFEWWNPAPEPETAVDWLHPPYAKYTQALGILVFGENTFGWRISSAIFGTAVIALIYRITKDITGRELVAVLAMIFASFDGLLLVQSRIAMNDIHVTFAILLTVWCYLKARPKLQLATNSLHQGWLLATGISAGLAMGTKWSGLFILIWTLGWELIFRSSIVVTAWIRLDRKKFLNKVLEQLRLVPWLIVTLLIVPSLMYLGSYWFMFWQGKSLICWEQQVVPNTCYATSEGTFISHFHELHKQIWWYQTHLTATHTYQSRPWQWMLNLRPVWYHVSYENNYRADIYALGNPIVFWFGLIAVVGVLFILCKQILNYITSPKLSLKTHTELLPKTISIALIASAYAVVWTPWFLSPRIMFFYHYTPAVPFLCIMASWWLDWGITTNNWLHPLLQSQPVSAQVKKLLRYLAIFILIICGVVFLVWYPHWTGIGMPLWVVNRVYFALPSWQ